MSSLYLLGAAKTGYGAAHNDHGQSREGSAPLPGVKDIHLQPISAGDALLEWALHNIARFPASALRQYAGPRLETP